MIFSFLPKGSFKAFGKKGMSFWQVWGEVFRNSSFSDYSEDQPQREHNVYASINALMSGTDQVAYTYTIDEFPEYIASNFAGLLRRSCIPKEDKDTRIQYLLLMLPHSFKWRSPKMRSLFNVWRNTEKKYDDDRERKGEETVYDIAQGSGRSLFYRFRRRNMTIAYLVDAVNNRFRQTYRIVPVLTVVGKRGSAFDNVARHMVDFCQDQGMNINRVDNEIVKYFQVLSPTAGKSAGSALSQIGDTVVTDEIAAKMFSYEQGIVGVGDKYVGTDVETGRPVFKKFKGADGSKAENILIAAKTGAGKSGFLKGFNISVCADKNAVSTFNDIDGEYNALYNLMEPLLGKNILRINMSAGSGRYFDPVTIFDHRILGDLDQYDDNFVSIVEGLYQYAFTATVGVLATMANISHVSEQGVSRGLGKSDLLDANRMGIRLLNYAVSKTYQEAGVSSSDMGTWALSKDLTLFDVFNMFKRLLYQAQQYQRSFAQVSLQEQERVYDPVLDALTDKSSQTRKVYDALLQSLQPYLDREFGAMSSWLRDRVTLSEVADAKVVINSFGLEGGNAATISEVSLALSMLYSTHIMYFRSIIAKSRGQFSYQFFEEFQRYGDMRGAYNTVNSTLTGGRKLGVVNFILTNKLSSLIDNDVFGILQNTTSRIIGAQADAEQCRYVCKGLGIKQFTETLIQITRNTRTSTDAEEMHFTDMSDYGDDRIDLSKDAADFSYDKVNKYSYAFLALLDDESPVVLRMELPKSLVNSAYMRTTVKKFDD